VWIKNVEFVTSVFHLKDLPDEGLPELAFAGRSNVGKSSLLNRLIGRKGFVKVSQRPGYTQSLNFFLANKSFYLVDLPGYGFARAPKNAKKRWQKLVEGYLEKRKGLIGVVCILDIRRDPDQLDMDLFYYLHYLGRQIWVVVNKADKLGQPKRYARLKSITQSLPQFTGRPWVISAKTGLGIQELSQHLSKALPTQ